MKRRKIILALVMAVSVMALAGCGKKEPIPACDAFHTESIWFSVDEERGFAKNSIIQAVYAFDGEGNVTVYDHVDGVFEFSSINNDMSDEEILEVVKEAEMEVREEMDIYEEPQPQPVELQIFTDDTGNATEEERIRHTEDTSGMDMVINKDLVPVTEAQTIYDMQFMGYTGLWTKVQDEDHPGFTLDSIDTPGVQVD